MSEGSSKAREISLGDDFGDVAVKVNGVQVEVHTDGSILAYTNGPVQVHPANDDVETKAGATPEIGDEMEDGTIHQGHDVASAPGSWRPHRNAISGCPSDTENLAGQAALCDYFAGTLPPSALTVN